MTSTDDLAAATARFKASEQKRKHFTAVGILAIVILAVAIITLIAVKDRNSVDRGTSTAIATESQADVVKASNGYDYSLHYLPHKKGVIIDGGFPEGSTPEEKREIVARAAAHDPFVLWYFLTRIYDMDAPNMKQLEDGDLRVSWHKRLLVLLEASDFTEVNLEGKTFFNEGYAAGTVTAASTTFSGKVPGTEIKYPGKKPRIVKNNCVNRQTKARPHGAKILRHRHEHGKGPDTTNGAARQRLRDGNAVRTSTPGYTGNGEDVVNEQNATAGSTAHNDVGHAGTGTGTGGTTQSGSNSSGEINNGGGAADTALPGGVDTPATGDPGKPH